ncbi:hypothetical protein P875_00034132 [Aspergillus parasiticus SU-1]|uniref:Uncharacterized protein n=1 Tax=Aspergillus parasiticus (strain ATCC 56775 / NRRL 5862 / SRRC 143 / SU-1) TaxID=1403190 RepID=A0A0F0I7B7_ASPPU|nr:hypothetical protein P875_00034132 [Aspergillus parasiticus SU-1]
MKFLASILALTAIAGVSAVPTSNSATTHTITSGELTYKGEGVVLVALPHPMQIVYLGNASAMGITVAGHAKADACSASLDQAPELAGPDWGIVAS